MEQTKVSPAEEKGFSRRTFLKMAAGSALGAALFSLPNLSLAKSSGSSDLARQELKAVAYSQIPQDCQACAKASNLISRNYQYVIDQAQGLKDGWLRDAVCALIQNPIPTLMQEYTSSSSIAILYAKLAAAGLIDTAKIDKEHLLPPYDGNVQPFMTAPGSGYGSHHPYPGGLATHVSANVHITQGLIHTYENVFCYDVDTDIALAGELLHDNMKPFVFQWQKDGSSLKEYTIAGQGAHHVLSIAESMYRGLPPQEVVAQACAHGAPNDAKGEADVVSWLKAGAIVAQKDPVKYGVLNAMGTGLPSPHHQEGYLVHLGDHDWVLSSPSAQKTSAVLKKIAVQEYGMSEADSKGARFNYFKNYVESQLSCMYLNHLQAEKNGEALIAQAVRKVVIKG